MKYDPKPYVKAHDDFLNAWAKVDESLDKYKDTLKYEDPLEYRKIRKSLQSINGYDEVKRVYKLTLAEARVLYRKSLTNKTELSTFDDICAGKHTTDSTSLLRGELSIKQVKHK